MCIFLDDFNFISLISSDNESIKLVIHYGGSVSKEDNDYRYIGQLGCESVQWKASEIRWENFETFLRDSKVLAPIALIWYKEVAKEMSELKYVFDNMNVDMGELRLVGQVAGEIHVFIQHECLEHVNRREDDDDGHDADEDVDDNDGDEDESEDDDDERPRENDEPEKSEDETPAEENVHENQEKDMVGEGDQNVVDDGDEVVIDAGNGADDERFNSLFEEGAKCKKPDCHDDEEKDEEAREVEESDEEYKGYELGDDEYPDTPVESDEEWEQWTNQKISKGKGNSKFHGDFDKPPYIWLFQKFHSGMEFKDQLLRYSLNTQYDVKMARSEANRIAAICCKEKCKWRVYCSVEVPLNKWMVKVCHMNHNHGKSSRVSMLKQGVIAGLFREELRRNINLPASEIKDTIKARYNIVVPISKCYRGRRIALDTIVQAQSIQFGMLWDYEAELIRTHPRITTEVCTVPVNGGQMFDCFYICFEEFREAWKNNCRPVIGLDGCFLKWELTGDLLSAVGRDADNRMFPIAWAVVRGENKDTWGWFIKKLKQDLDLGEGDNFTIISDKQKVNKHCCSMFASLNLYMQIMLVMFWQGLVIAVGNELRKAEHRMCARHIYANWKKTFSRSEYKNLFWGVAYSYNEGEYNDKMKLVESYDPAAHASLVSLEPHRWCRAFFSLESRCHDVHNNLSEAFNRTIKIARSKPILNLLEDIRRQAMRRISRRYMKAYNCDTILTPITMAILEKARVDNKHCSMIKSSSSLYEVLEFALTCSYTVNITTHECACRRWDLTGIGFWFVNSNMYALRLSYLISSYLISCSFMESDDRYTM